MSPLEQNYIKSLKYQKLSIDASALNFGEVE